MQVVITYRPDYDPWIDFDLQCEMNSDGTVADVELAGGKLCLEEVDIPLDLREIPLRVLRSQGRTLWMAHIKAIERLARVAWEAERQTDEDLAALEAEKRTGT